jgi:hypothetical protein
VPMERAWSMPVAANRPPRWQRIVWIRSMQAAAGRPVCRSSGLDPFRRLQGDFTAGSESGGLDRRLQVDRCADGAGSIHAVCCWLPASPAADRVGLDHAGGCKSIAALAADRVDSIHASGCRSTGVPMERARSIPASAGRLHCRQRIGRARLAAAGRPLC